MSKLEPCQNCGGLLPRLQIPSCPHCDAVFASSAVAAGKQARANQVTSPRGLGPRLTQLAIGSSLAMTLMACYGAPQGYYEEPAHPDGQSDRDGDGFGSADDCDDRDPKVHPGASDVEGDSVDSDCDGNDGPKQQFAEPPGSNQEPLQIAEPPANSEIPE